MDDVNQRCEGTERKVFDGLVPAAVDFHARAGKQELDISGKSMVIASSMDLARKISNQLEAASVAAGAGSAGTDLGIERDSGRRCLVEHTMHLRSAMG